MIALIITQAIQYFDKALAINPKDKDVLSLKELAQAILHHTNTLHVHNITQTSQVVVIYWYQLVYNWLVLKEGRSLVMYAGHRIIIDLGLHEKFRVKILVGK